MHEWLLGLVCSMLQSEVRSENYRISFINMIADKESPEKIRYYKNMLEWF